jgi:hypothetical protein
MYTFISISVLLIIVGWIINFLSIRRIKVRYYYFVIQTIAFLSYFFYAFYIYGNNFHIYVLICAFIHVVISSCLIGIIKWWKFTISVEKIIINKLKK